MKWFTKRKQQQNKTAVTYMAAAALVAMLLSLWIGMQQSVWFDEAYSVLVAKQAPSEIIHLASVDTHPPAYYLMLHGWGNLFGWSDFALRSLSVLAFGGSIVVAGLLVRKLFGNRAAVYTVVLATLAPLLVRYGFEIRMYAVASLIGVLATYVMVRAREGGRQSAWLWFAYSVLLALGLLTLYYLAFLWVAHFVWLIHTDRNKLKKPFELKWLWAYVGAAVLFVPWLPKFLSQVNNGALANIGQPMNLEQIIGVISFNSLYKPLWQVDVLETAVVIVVIGWLAWAYARVYKDNKKRQNLMLLTAYIAVPVVILMVISLLRPMYVERYLSHVAIGLIMLVAVVLSKATAKYKSRQQYMVGFMASAVMVIGLLGLARVGNFNFQRMQKPDVAHAMESVGCSNASVVAADPYVATELSYYLRPGCEMRFYSEWQTMGGGYAPFSDSPMRISEKEIPVLEDKLYYAYYDAPKLIVPNDYSKISSETFGGLTVDQYEIIR